MSIYVTESNYLPQPIGNGTATRTYLNAAGTVIGVDEFGIEFLSVMKRNMSTTLHDNAWGITGALKKMKRTLLNIDGTNSRTIASVILSGDFDSYSADSGDYRTVTWNFSGGNVAFGFGTDAKYKTDTL